MKDRFLVGWYSSLALVSLAILHSIAPGLVFRQFIFFCLGLALMLVISRVPFSVWIKLSPALYGLINLGLLATLVVGTVTKGSTRWIAIGSSIHIQPSQLIVPIVGLFAVRFLSRHPARFWANLIKFGLVIGIPAGLIMIEPDLGTTILFLLSMAVILFMFDLPFSKISWLLGMVVAGSILGWVMILKPYQKQRITSFLQPTADQSGAGYNAHQAVIAVGSGQIFGRGIGQGSQSHLRFLPERQTDFVFASLAEELGFVGSIIVLSIYVGLFITLFLVTESTTNQAAQAFGMAVIVHLILQTVINIGMNAGLFPITGITLPLLSYGGSSIVSIAISLGLIMSISSMPQTTRSTFIT